MATMPGARVGGGGSKTTGEEKGATTVMGEERGKGTEEEGRGFEEEEGEGEGGAGS